MLENPPSAALAASLSAPVAPVAPASVAAAPRAAIDELLRSHRRQQARIDQLEADNADLRRELAVSAERLQWMARRLARAEARQRPEAAEDESARARGEARTAPCARAACGCRLSAREREVIVLLTEGCRSPLIAERLGITVATVEVHRRNIMRKLELHSVAALTKYALREGLTSL